MRKLILPEQSWAADDAQTSEAEVAKSTGQVGAMRPVDPAEVSLSYARI